MKRANCAFSWRETMPCVRESVLANREVEQLREADLTYNEVGSTRAVSLPCGYAHLRRTIELGSGVGRFEQAARVVLGWDMHRRAGLSVRASDVRVAEEAVAVLRVGVRILGVNAPVRVVYVIDEPRRKGFAYGTLNRPGDSGGPVCWLSRLA